MVSETNTVDLLNQTKNLPDLPGVYKMFSAENKCIYVGKAKNLKKRVSSYFLNLKNHTRKTQALVVNTVSFDVTVTENENEALILESNLIKEYRPRYNILLRDDKSYPFIMLEDNHSFPRLVFYRGPRSQGKKFFGPFPSVFSVKSTLNMLHKTFQIRQCEKSVFENRSRPCLQHQIRRCSAPCVGLIDELAYKKDLNSAIMALEGKSAELFDKLNAEMDTESNNLNFESAARFRDQIKSLSSLQLEQSVDNHKGDVDVIAIGYESGIACIQIFFVRKGRVLGSKSYFPSNTSGWSSEVILNAFLNQFYLTYHNDRETPSVIVINQQIADADNLKIAIKHVCGKTVSISTNPVKGNNKKLMELALKNCELALKRRLASQVSFGKRWLSLANELGVLQLNTVECFDISHLGGEHPVASCVVFDSSGPKKSSYRKFKIETAKASDDYSAMLEVLQRRLKRTLNEGGVLPDLLLVDGGKGQVKQAFKTVHDLKIESVKILGISKGISRKDGLERFIAIDQEGNFKQMSFNNETKFLLQYIRDEAHRFAVDAQRKSRSKSKTRSRLDSIEGIGNKRRSNLVKHFGGVVGVERAGVSDLERVPGISRSLARKIYDSLRL